SDHRLLPTHPFYDKLSNHSHKPLLFYELKRNMNLLTERYSGRAMVLLVFIFYATVSQAQTDVIPKVHHIEPLFVDLVRDLGARKGEKEVNIAADFRNVKHYNEYGVLA